MNQELYKDKCGFVYAMESTSLPGMLKIGATRLHPLRRADQLSASTGVPTPFKLIYYRDFDDCFLAETLIHKRLAAKRVNESREFFKVSLDEVVDVLEEVSREVKSTGTTLGARRGTGGESVATPWADLFASFEPSDEPNLNPAEIARCRDLSAHLAGRS